MGPKRKIAGIELEPKTKSTFVLWLWPIAAGCALLLVFRSAGAIYYNSYLLDTGSARFTTPRMAIFLAMWAIFGIVAASLLALGIARFISQKKGSSDPMKCLDAAPDGLWIVFGSLAAAIISIGLRIVLLQGMPLTDDESSYHFMSELLASGHLRAVSPPAKLFFDRIFMINDGGMHASYFIGWPALMVPGVWAGATGYMNALYSGLTVPAIFLVLRLLAGGRWAKAGMLLYLSSPMLMVGAATELSHTSCFMALAWLTWFFLRSQEKDSPAWTRAGFASLFALAFFIRPISAIGIGAPLLFSLVFRFRSLRGRLLSVCLFSLIIPATIFGAAFLAVNKAQNGSYLKTSYQRYIEYMKENGYRFSWYSEENPVTGTVRPMFVSTPTEVAANVGVALFRLNFDIFGWPSCFLFAFFAGRQRMAALWWISLLCYFAVMLPFPDSGIDSFGPLHFFETALPILILTVLGLRNLSETGQSWDRYLPRAEAPGIRLKYFSSALALSLMFVSLAVFVPVRLGALARITENIKMPFEAVQNSELHNAVIFAPQPFAPNCRSTPTNHFVFWRPNNDPKLKNDILWLNHITVNDDRRFMKYVPGRSGYVMVWAQPCQVRLLSLSKLQSGSVPNGEIGGSGEGPRWP